MNSPQCAMLRTTAFFDWVVIRSDRCRVPSGGLSVTKFPLLLLIAFVPLCSAINHAVVVFALPLFSDHALALTVVMEYS
jgi:hypothetical protein